MNKLEEIIRSNAEIKQELEEEKKKVAKLESGMEAKIKEIVNEEKEKEKRAGNIIIRGFPESDKDDETEAREDDLITVKQLLQQILPAENIVGEIVDLHRLGRRREGSEARPRGIKVIMKRDSHIKEKIFKAKESRQKINRKFPYLKFFPDRTKLEQEKYHLLVQDLKERSNNGERNLMIRDLKIIQRTPSNASVADCHITQESSGSQSH